MHVSFNCCSNSSIFFTDVILALRDCQKTVKVRVGGFESLIDCQYSKSITNITISIVNQHIDLIEFDAANSSYEFFSNFLKKFQLIYKLAQSFHVVRIGGREFNMGNEDYFIWKVVLRRSRESQLLDKWNKILDYKLTCK